MTNSSLQPPTAPYDRDAVQEILQLAIARRDDTEQYTRDQLVELADELGVDRADLVAAEQVWLEKHGQKGQQAAFAAAEARRLKQVLGRYGIVNGFLVLMDLVSSHHLGWSVTIALGWGMFVTLDWWKSSQTETEAYQQRLQKWLDRHRTVDDWL